MFERFTDQARRAVVLAQEESSVLGHGSIGVEHVLLGLLREPEGMAGEALRGLGLTIAGARDAVRDVDGEGTAPVTGHIPFTPDAKRALERALRAALQLGDHEMRTEHLLLGLLDADDATLGRVLEALGVTPEVIRAAVLARVDADPDDAEDAEEGTDEARLVLLTSAARSGGAYVHMGMGPTAGGVCSFCGRDLWDVDHYVRGAGIAMCEECIDAATAAIAGVRHDGGQKELHLPPRVSGSEPEPGAAETAAGTLHLLFGVPPITAHVDWIEDGTTFLASLRQVEQRYGGQGPSIVHVERLRFVDAETVDARFTLTLRSGPGVRLEGRLVRRAGRWLVSRELIIQALTVAGSPPGRI